MIILFIYLFISCMKKKKKLDTYIYWIELYVDSVDIVDIELGSCSIL